MTSTPVASAENMAAGKEESNVMWGLILAIIAVAIASDGEMRIKKLQERLWHDEKMIKELRAELHARSS